MRVRGRSIALTSLVLALGLVALTGPVAAQDAGTPAPESQPADAPAPEAPPADGTAPAPAPDPPPPPAWTPPAVWTMAAVQARLVDLAYDPGPVDGQYGPMTRDAMYAFQKVHGLTVDGGVHDADLRALEHPVTPVVLRPDGGPDRIEVDLARQLLVLYSGGALKLITHVSTGGGYHYCAYGSCRDAITPTGDFSVQRFVHGWEHNALGDLYNSTYIENEIGIAIHGSPSVPLHPASHGCVRIPMHIADYFQNLVFIGENVFVV